MKKYLLVWNGLCPKVSVHDESFFNENGYFAQQACDITDLEVGQSYVVEKGHYIMRVEDDFQMPIRMQKANEMYTHLRELVDEMEAEQASGVEDRIYPDEPREDIDNLNNFLKELE
jgi:hypothetical protein